MDMFVRFNRNSVQDRQMDTLIGLGKGLAADGEISQQEAEFLLSWLVQNSQALDNPVVSNLLDKVSDMLSDGILDPDESLELLMLLKGLGGEPSIIGELSKTATLPVDHPAPPIEFVGKSFLFTGTCTYGTRRQCQEAVESLGSICAKVVTKSLDYLVLGTYVTDSWAHESFGRKIEKAVGYRDSGVPIAIVTEEHWANEAGF